MAIITGQSIVGWKNPVFLILDKTTNTLEDTIELHLADEDGLWEEYEDYVKETTTIDRKIKQFFEGRRYTFTLSYSKYSSKENTLKIQRLLNWQATNQHKIILIPRNDAGFRDRSFEVVKDPGSNITLGVRKGGFENKGNKGIVLVFKTVSIHRLIDWRDPASIQIGVFYFTRFFVRN
jgi:hypothetical protein